MSVMTGAAVGAAVGTFVPIPGIGTFSGAALGAAAGYLMGEAKDISGPKATPGGQGEGRSI